MVGRKEREQYNITKQNDLFKVTEAQQRRMCLKNLSLNVDGTRGKSERSARGGAWMEGRLGYAGPFMGDGG